MCVCTIVDHCMVLCNPRGLQLTEILYTLVEISSEILKSEILVHV